MKQSLTGRSATLVFEQGDGTAPQCLLAVNAPGEKGFGVSHHRFSGGARISATPRDHLIVIQPRRVALMKCHLAGATSEHAAPDWNVTVCPAGARAEAECDEDVDTVILSLPVETVAFAASQHTDRAFSLDPRLHGLDPALKQFVLNVMWHAPETYVAGPLWWDQGTDLLVGHLLANYAGVTAQGASKLSRRQIRLVQDHVRDNIGEALTVDILAAAIGFSRAHFTRAFTQATGLTPHHYVMRTRLHHAHDLITRSGFSPAAAAADAGFVDQSHLATWTRRIYGTTIGHMQKRSRQSTQ